MARTFILSGAAALALVACAPPPPVSNPRGVGFDDYAEYQLRQARAEAGVAPQPTVVQPPAAAPLQGGAIPAGELAAAGIGQAAPQAPVGAPLATAAGTAPAAPASNGAALSDEQDFGAVAARETIESDAERLARLAAEREEVAPTALPPRAGSEGPNIVAFALATTHAKGTPVYRRSGLSGQRRFQRNCAKYVSADDAQRDFLARGGPERDRLGIDPDGDGFACGWDPAPFRLVRQGAAVPPAAPLGPATGVETTALDGGN